MRTRTLIVISSALLLTACDGNSHDSSPDPGGSPGTHQAVIQMPNGFYNVAFSCHGTTGIYVTSHGAGTNNSSGIAVLTNDPTCKR